MVSYTTSIKQIRVRYADFMTLWSIFKGTVVMNYNSLEKCEMRVMLLDFELEIPVEHATSF